MSNAPPPSVDQRLGFQTATKVLFGTVAGEVSFSPAPPSSSSSSSPSSPHSTSPRRKNMSAKLALFKKAGDRTLAKARVKKTKSEIIGMQRAMAVKKRIKANRIALLKRCYTALHKQPAERTEKEIMMLVDFTTTNKFFTDKFARIGDPYHRELCRRMQHRVYRLGGYIIQQGEIGDEFYIIMTGTVRVQLEPQDEGDDPKTLVALGPGDSFGELALLNEKPRAASCVSSSLKCEVMVIRKKDFKEILGKSHIATLQARAKWLRVVPLFRSLDPKSLLVVASHMSTRSYRRHEIIVKEGKHAGSMFLLVKGRCRVFKSDDNRLLELPGLVPGQMFGELGVILPGSTRTASVIAEDVNVHALELSSHDFFEYLGHMQDLLLDECLGAYPSELDIGDRLKNHQRWAQYRKGLVCQLHEDTKWQNLAKRASAPGVMHPACQRGTPRLLAQNPAPRPPVDLLRTSAFASKEIAKMQHEQKDAMPWRQAHAVKWGQQDGIAAHRRKSHIDDKNVDHIRRLTRRASLRKQGAHGHNHDAGQLQGADYTHTLRHHAESRFRRRLSLRGTNRTLKVPIIASRTIGFLGRHTTNL